MLRPYQILIPLLSLFFIRVDLTDLWPLRLQVKVLKVYDGDTVLVKFQKQKLRIRISKIDTPEMGQPFLRSQKDAGESARDCVLKLISVGKEVELTLEKYDMYRRVIGDLNRLSFRAVQAGCSGLYPHANFASKHEKFIYLRALKKAQHSRKGIWREGGVRQPKLWRKTSKRNARLR